MLIIDLPDGRDASLRATVNVWCRGPATMQCRIGGRCVSRWRRRPAANSDRHAGPPCESLSARFVPPAGYARGARRALVARQRV